MAYFPNGCSGEVLDIQCLKCKYGNKPCPIYWMQCNWNYLACNDKIAREIMDYFISNNGTCAMFEAFKEDFQIKE
jgi:hypothetical protein